MKLLHMKNKEYFDKKKSNFLILIFFGLFNVFLVYKLYEDTPFYANILVNRTRNQTYSIKFGATQCSPLNLSAEKYSVTLNGKTYPQHTPLHLNESINFACLNQSKTLKKILFWNTWFDDPTFGIGIGVREPFQKQNCPVTNCELLVDKSRINESDYVVIHMWDAAEWAPDYRPSYQRWILMLYESPLRSPEFITYNGVFNLTSTYRVDSDFPGFYQSGSNFIWKENATFDTNYDFTSGKTSFAAAVVSNCFAPSLRLEYINELNKYVNVDVFGQCGQECPTHFKNSNKTGDCKEIIGRDYKFYLAFENTICDDYITEKFFGILMYNVIPVVLGGGSYSNFVRIAYICNFF